MAALTLGIFCIAALIYTQERSNLYVSQEVPNLAALSVTCPNEKSLVDAEGTSPATQPLAIWVETNPNMFGFLENQNSNCVPSAYEYLLNHGDDLAKVFGSLNQAQWYYFNDASAQNTQVGSFSLRPAELKARATYGILDKDVLADSSQFRAGVTSGSLHAVMEQIDITRPNLIFTDFEQMRLEEHGALEAAAKQLFQGDRDMTIIGMYSSYGGVLFDYDGAGVDYLYGFSSSEKNNFIQILNSNKYHRSPRSFYAILIGTTEECKQLRDKILEMYQAFNFELENRSDKEWYLTHKASHKKNASDFNQARVQEFYYDRLIEKLRIVDGDNVQIVLPTEAKESGVAELLREDGAYQVTFSKESVKTLTLSLHITPNLPGFEKDYQDILMDWNLSLHLLDYSNIENVEQLRMLDASKTEETAEVTQLIESVASGQSQILACRGTKGQEVKFLDFVDNGEWFKFSDEKPGPQGLDYLLKINAEACTSGIYRLHLDVGGTRNEKNAVPFIEPWVSDWSIKKDDFPGQLKDAIKEKPAKGERYLPQFTVELEEQVDSIARAQMNVLQNKHIDFACINIDICINP